MSASLTALPFPISICPSMKTNVTLLSVDLLHHLIKHLHAKPAYIMLNEPLSMQASGLFYDSGQCNTTVNANPFIVISMAKWLSSCFVFMNFLSSNHSWFTNAFVCISLGIATWVRVSCFEPCSPLGDWCSLDREQVHMRKPRVPWNRSSNNQSLLKLL